MAGNFTHSRNAGSCVQVLVQTLLRGARCDINFGVALGFRGKQGVGMRTVRGVEWPTRDGVRLQCSISGSDDCIWPFEILSVPLVPLRSHKGQDKPAEASPTGHVQTRGITSHPLAATRRMSVV